MSLKCTHATKHAVRDGHNCDLHPNLGCVSHGTCLKCPDNTTKGEWPVAITVSRLRTHATPSPPPVAVALEQWPKWTRRVILFRELAHSGVGDTFQAVSDQFSESEKKQIMLAAGITSCKCAHLRTLWNALYPYAPSAGRSLFRRPARLTFTLLIKRNPKWAAKFLRQCYANALPKRTSALPNAKTAVES